MQIPGYKELQISDIVCDYNGTIAKDGILLQETADMIKTLAGRYRVHIVTADTFGSVAEQIEGLEVELKILSSSDHTTEKRAYVEEIGAHRCAAIGNGNNDLQMLHTAALSVAVVGDEGCFVQTMMAADIVCRSGAEALALFTIPKRLAATLRK